jgi:uncharacterized protein YjbI with pentapeptide repeats
MDGNLRQYVNLQCVNLQYVNLQCVNLQYISLQYVNLQGKKTLNTLNNQ